MVTETGTIKKITYHRDRADDIFSIFINRRDPAMHKDVSEARFFCKSQNDSFIKKLKKLGRMSKGLLVSYSIPVHATPEHKFGRSCINVLDIAPLSGDDEKRVLVVDKLMLTANIHDVAQETMKILANKNTEVSTNHEDWKWVQGELAEYEEEDRLAMITLLSAVIVDQMLQHLITS